jgi:tRNA (cmo5U34)-methyltransferase
MPAASHFDDPDFVRRYVAGPGQFVPGYEAMQRMALQLLRERAPRDAEILVLGAGGGLEIEAFARRQTAWRFTAVDPAGEMIAEGQRRVEAIDASARVRWIEGYVFDAPPGPFDGASCLLTLHFVPDDGAKVETLKALRARLRPGAPFVLVDLCMDLRARGATRQLRRYRDFALGSGADRADVDATCTRLVNVLKLVSPRRDRELLQEAGFRKPKLFYAALAWRGWVSRA